MVKNNIFSFIIYLVIYLSIYFEREREKVHVLGCEAVG